MTPTHRAWRIVAIAGTVPLLITVACGGGGGSTGSGGATSAGGASGSTSGGGVPGTGGSTGTGGVTGSGGVPSTGGSTASGGSTGSGGASNGGSTHSGGKPGSGGVTAAGGAGGRGGQGGRGGAPSTGGVSPTGGRGGTPTGGTTGAGGRGGGAGGNATGNGGSGAGPTIGNCPILPANHIFNTPIDSLPVDPQSAQYLATIGNHNVHLDLGWSTDASMTNTYYGIPYNVVNPGMGNWSRVNYHSADPDLDWDPRPEADCVDSSMAGSHPIVRPCTATAAPNPILPIPINPLVEGGSNSNSSQLPYGDHHILVIDLGDCRLYETFHSYPITGSAAWDIFGSAIFDLRSNALRPDTWTSADAAGFPIFPLLLRAAEANTKEIKHALRFTITSSKIRNSHVWPARHHTGNGTASTNLPPMGQLFRLKASYTIPSTFSAQSRAIAQAMKTYGMYIADGGSDMYVTGEPNNLWEDTTLSQVQSINSSQFEAVDLASIRQRAGFDANSAAVPPP